MSILTNATFVSVAVMCVLCLLKVNILVSIVAAAMTAGVISGLTVQEIMGILIGGMGGNAETALSYILLGALAYAVQETGVAGKLCRGIEKVFGKNGKLFLILLAVISCFSQNLIPIHVAFIPILIPPLLGMMNRMQIDRRAATCATAFGLVTPYMLVPMGFGLIFHGIVADEITRNGLLVEKMDVWKTLLIPALGMVAGLLFAIFITYRKPRVYTGVQIGENHQPQEEEGKKMTRQQWGAVIGAVCAVVIQVISESLPLGALCGLLVMVAFGAIPFKKFDKMLDQGVAMLGFIGFVMMVSAGYGDVIRETDSVKDLVNSAVSVMGGNQAVAAVIMLLLGLLITLGLGSSFATLPVIAAIYVPICMELGFSTTSTIILVAVAGVLGDAGSPASSTTLGISAGFNVDGQHDHIWDTCIPTFLHYNIPLFVFGFAAAMLFA